MLFASEEFTLEAGPVRLSQDSCSFVLVVLPVTLVAEPVGLRFDSEAFEVVPHEGALVARPIWPLIHALTPFNVAYELPSVAMSIFTDIGS